MAAVLLFMLTACAADPGRGTLSDDAAPDASPALMPARPGSDATGDPSGDLGDLTEVSGTVKTAQDGLVLIALTDEGGDYMLRLSDNTRWDEGVDKTFAAGNTVSCMVKPEPTLTTPPQGEVLEVIANDAP